MTALIADIGGTHARFALTDGHSIYGETTLRAAAFPSLAAAALHYIQTAAAAPATAAISIAATLAPNTDTVELVNNPAWNFSHAELQTALGMAQVRLFNDFEALAYAVPALSDKDLRRMTPGTAAAGAPIAVIGPGTGLGMAGIIFIDGKTHVIPSEGGNATFAAPDREAALLVDIVRQGEGTAHVSAEDLISGPGLVRIYRALCTREGHAAPLPDAADIAAAAASCPLAARSIDLFSYWLGSVAGNLALTLNATAGVYIAGGIVPKLQGAFSDTRYRQGFSEKGPYSDYLAAIPSFLVTHPYPALEGLRRVLS